MIACLLAPVTLPLESLSTTEENEKEEEEETNDDHDVEEEDDDEEGRGGSSGLLDCERETETPAAVSSIAYRRPANKR